MLKQKPYHLFLIAGIIMLLFSLLEYSSVIDIHLHDTYFVMPMKGGVRFAGILMLAFWLTYLLVHKILFSTKLTFWHVTLTIFCVVSILLITDFFTLRGLAGEPRRYYDDEYNTLRLFLKTENILIFIFMLLLLAQLLILLNIAIGLFKKLKSA